MEKNAGRVGRDLTNGPIIPTLMTFAVPIILTNLIQQLYSMVDLLVIGHAVGNIGTVSVSVGGYISDIMTPIAATFAMSGQILVAQFTGAGHKDRAKRITGNLFTIMFIFGVAIMVCMLVFGNVFLDLVNTPDAARSGAESYLKITAFGIPFVYGYNAVCGTLRGMGESKRPMFFIIIAASINVFLDILLVTAFDLAAAGTAIATVLSQIGAFTASFVFMYKKRDEMGFELKLSYFRCDRENSKNIIILAVPQVVRVLLVNFSILWINSGVNAYGEIASGTNSIGNKLISFMEMFVQGTESASASVVGQNLAAKEPKRARNTVLATWGFSMTVAAVSAFLFLTMPHQLYAIFTEDPDVIEFGAVYLSILAVAIFINGTTASFQSMVTGSGFVSLGFLLGVVDGLLSRIGFALLFLNVFDMGVISYFWGAALARTITGVIVVLYFVSGKWRRRKLFSDG